MRDLLATLGEGRVLMALLAVLLAGYCAFKLLKPSSESRGFVHRVDFVIAGLWALVSVGSLWSTEEFLPVLPKLSWWLAMAYLLTSALLTREGIRIIRDRREP